MKWVYLILAGISEVTWATAMKYADGFTKLVPSIITVVGYIVSAVFLSFALKKLPPRHRLCDVDRLRHHRHEPARRLALPRIAEPGPSRLHRDDCRWDCGAEGAVRRCFSDPSSTGAPSYFVKYFCLLLLGLSGRVIPILPASIKGCTYFDIA